jgi:hypothetical protein
VSLQAQHVIHSHQPAAAVRVSNWLCSITGCAGMCSSDGSANASVQLFFLVHFPAKRFCFMPGHRLCNFE